MHSSMMIHTLKVQSYNSQSILQKYSADEKYKRIMICFYTAHSMASQLVGSVAKAQDIQVLQLHYTHNISFRKFLSYQGDKILSSKLSMGTPDHTS